MYNSFSMVRGDSFNLAITLKNADGTLLVLDAADTIVFTLKRNLSDTTAAIEKTLAFDERGIKLLPTDTSTLDAGNYLFDIEIRYGNGDIQTIVKPTYLYINEGVSNG